MDNRLTPNQQNEIVEDALKNVQLAPMPRSITTNVMARIQKSVRPVFITWKDFALSLIVVIYIGALFFAAQSLPPIFVAKLRIQGILLYQDILVNASWLVPMALFGFAVFLSALTGMYLFQLTIDRRQ